MFGLFKKKQDFTAEVRPTGRAVQVKAGDNLLKAGLEAGLAWPHDCRVGSCGTCRCKLVDGKIKPLADFSYVLTGEELKNGMILACQTSLRSDVTVEVELVADAQVAPPHETTGSIAAIRHLTHDIQEIRIKLDEPCLASDGSDAATHRYRAGQYADLKVDGIEAPRSYSFATYPKKNQTELTFYVRLVPGGEMTSWLFEQDRTGARVSVAGPYGSFWLREGDGPILCIAGGSGMSAIKALLEDAAATGPTRDAVFLFGARSQKDLYCDEEIQAIAAQWERAGRTFRYTPVLSDEPSDSDWRGARGLVTEEISRQDLKLADCQAYLCGPPPMIDAAIAVLKKGGVYHENIHFDKFLDASSMPGGRK